VNLFIFTLKLVNLILRDEKYFVDFLGNFSAFTVKLVCLLLYMVKTNI